MDYEVNVCEKHHVKNTDGENKREVERLIAYIQRINNLDNLQLEYMYVYSMEMTVDDNAVSIANLGVVAGDKDHYRLKDGYRLVESQIWDENSEIGKLIQKATMAEDVSLDIELSVMDPMPGRFGSSYWSNSFETANAQSEHKIIEHGMDMNTGIYLYSEGENGVSKGYNGSSETILSDIENCCDVDEWYTTDFLLNLGGEKNWDEVPETRDKIMEILKEFAKKYDPLNEPDEPYEEQIYISNCPVVSSKDIPAFISEIQKVIDLAFDADEGVILEAKLKAYSGYPFAAMELLLDDDLKVRARYYRI